MRRFTNSEAQNVSDLVSVTEQMRLISRNLKTLKAKQDNLRKELKPILEKHGEAHNDSHIVTTETKTRKGYEVKANSFTSYHIANR